MADYESESEAGTPILLDDGDEPAPPRTPPASPPASPEPEEDDSMSPVPAEMEGEEDVEEEEMDDSDDGAGSDEEAGSDEDDDDDDAEQQSEASKSPLLQKWQRQDDESDDGESQGNVTDEEDDDDDGAGSVEDVAQSALGVTGKRVLPVPVAAGSDDGEDDEGDVQEDAKSVASAVSSVSTAQSIRKGSRAGAALLDIDLDKVVTKVSELLFDGIDLGPHMGAIRFSGKVFGADNTTHVLMTLKLEKMLHDAVLGAVAVERVIDRLGMWARQQDVATHVLVGSFPAGRSVTIPAQVAVVAIEANAADASLALRGMGLLHPRTGYETQGEIRLASRPDIASSIILAMSVAASKQGYHSLAIRSQLGSVTLLSSLGFRPEGKCGTIKQEVATALEELSRKEADADGAETGALAPLGRLRRMLGGAMYSASLTERSSEGDAYMLLYCW